MMIRLRKQSGLGLMELARVSGVHPSTISGWLASGWRQGEASLEEHRRARPVGVGRKLTMNNGCASTLSGVRPNR
jgi:transcriptional regulator with XRE-family HTH domain